MSVNYLCKTYFILKNFSVNSVMADNNSTITFIDKAQYDVIILGHDFYQDKYFKLIKKFTTNEEKLKEVKKKLNLLESQLSQTILKCTLFFY
jgi:glycerol-3-phosphate cytidylyltransferase-like family protein